MFMSGLRNKAMQKWLLSEADLILNKAITLAQGMEFVDLGTCFFKG